jgi:hypothetical protein
MGKNWMTDARAGRVRRSYDDGASITELADTFEMSRQDIVAILDGRPAPKDMGPLLPSGLPSRLRPEVQPCEMDCALVYERNMAASARTWQWRTGAAD